MRQDYLFVGAAIPFIGALLAKAPRARWTLHSSVLAMLQKELALFRERTEATGVDMDGIAPSFTNHAYIQFLLATAYRESGARPGSTRRRGARVEAQKRPSRTPTWPANPLRSWSPRPARPTPPRNR